MLRSQFVHTVNKTPPGDLGCDSLNAAKVDDIYCLSLLQPLLIGRPFLPISGSSLRPFCLVQIINDIVINGRRHIIEFGSGISTILIARLLKINNIDATLISFDHSEHWVQSLRALLEREQLSDKIELVFAPLSPCKIGLNDTTWYDTATVEKHTNGKLFDMLLIDGPPAYLQPLARSRYPALPYMVDKLADRSSIYLDDANRPGEQFILEKWSNDYPSIQFAIKGDTLAVSFRGQSYFTDPFGYYVL